jgi:hypothetical protein
MPPPVTSRRDLLVAVPAAVLARPAASAAGTLSVPPSTGPRLPGDKFQPRLFRSFFLGGFECSTHRRGDGVRLDLLASTQHDAYVVQDYLQLAAHGIRSARDGVRWHLVETAPGQYDWSSVLPMLRAAVSTATQVAWDLCHYGWPDDLDIFSAAFVERFARYARSFAELHLQETGQPPLLCLINEISFMTWAGSDRGLMRPAAAGRAGELKHQLVRATIAGTLAVREVAPEARFLAIDPMISVVPQKGQDPEVARAHHEMQFEAWDMLCGRRDPELGGGPELLDVIGVNYYWDNQWELGGRTLRPGEEGHRPPRDLITRVHERYGRSILLAETSIEGDARAEWLRYIGEEMRAAMRAGVPLEGICLYPVISYPLWEDSRYSPVGLFEIRMRNSKREVHQPLADELTRQQRLVGAFLSDR